MPEPIAVMPFANINRDPDLDWLSAGMSETMLSDLRREGRRVVMRDALDTAIAEMALQGVRPTDESSAARVGRLVGAKTMVFGGYQTAAGQIRITARFVEVETSLVLDAAMVTGPITNVLSLQDEILDKLVGRPSTPAPAAADRAASRRGSASTAPAKAPAEPQAGAPADRGGRARPDAAAATDRPSGENALEAYKRFSMSLSAVSAEERRRLLEQAMSLSPGFVYAKEQLEALEQYLLSLARARQDANAVKFRELLESDSAQPWERYAAATQLVGHYQSRRMLLTLLSELDWIENMEWDESLAESIRAYAALSRINALHSLGRLEQAIEYAKEVRESYPAHPEDRQLQSLVQSVESALLRLTRMQIERIEKLEDLDQALERYPAAYERLGRRVELYTEELQQSIAKRDEAAGALQEALDDPARAGLERELAQREDRLQGSRNLFQAAWDNLRREQVRECRTLHQHHAYRRAVAACLELAARIREDAHPNWERFEDEAISLAISALSAVGAFEEAGELVALYSANPERVYYRSVYNTVGRWPAELTPALPEPPSRR